MPSLRKGVTVPEGNVAFVITNPDDVTLPVGLTDREKAVKDKLESLGYTITYVSFSRLEISNLSKARFVIGVEYPSLGINTINSLIESGKGVALLHNAGSVIGGSWKSYGSEYLQVENGKAFLEGYGSGVSFKVGLGEYCISEKYPPDWTVIGTNASDPNYKTAFYKEHASGGKGVIFTYNPKSYNWSGESIFARIIEWIAMPSLRKGVTVPEGNVAFVITNPDDVTLPVGLTDREKAVKDKLESLGYIITYVSFGRLEISDLSKARFILGVEYPSLGINTINSLIESGKGVALLHNAGSVIGGSWKSYSSEYLQVENGKAFLEGYGSGVSFKVGLGEYCISGKYPPDWTVIGRNTADVSYKTAFYREHDSGGRGALFTYNPQYYTAEGDKIFAQIAEWASGGLPIGKPTPKPSFTLSLASGLNFISLPMKPDVPFTARSFSKKLSSTLVIKYDAPSQEFVPFVPEASKTDGFVIEGGQGYIVNLLEKKQVTFTGTVWTNTPPASPKQMPDEEDTIWAFAVAGVVSTESDLNESFSGLKVTVKNQRTGQLSQCVLTGDMGEFATAFVDMSRKSVVKTGDMLEITIRNSRGQLVSAPVVREVSKIDLAKATIVVNLRLGEAIPSQSQLFQNYPNPFNPETWIPFQLAESAEVTIRIYTVAGQLVRMLNLGQKAAGWYLDKDRAAYWDGRNEYNERISSGVYFYSIEAGNFRATRKLVVAK
jgi:ribosomal protein L10